MNRMIGVLLRRRLALVPVTDTEADLERDEHGNEDQAVDEHDRNRVEDLGIHVLARLRPFTHDSRAYARRNR